MVSHIIAVLRRSPLVKDLEVVELVEEENVQLLRVKAEIVDGLADPDWRIGVTLG
jgi:hypothetical protein